jgi:TIR domain-containing protein
MPRIFISYRVREQAGYAVLLDRVLTERFGPDAVFRDFRSIRPGDDFVQEIFSSLRSCTVLLAVIGPEWTVPARHLGPDRDQDWVHREIAEAFTSGVRVIPVLIEDAELPKEPDLPSDIAALSRRQALRVQHSNVERDIEHIVTEIGRLLPVQAHGTPPDPAA